MKAVTVISASAPRRVATEPDPAPSDHHEQTRTSALVWAVVGAVMLAVLVGFLVFGGERGRGDPGVVVPSESSTPEPLIPDVLTRAPSLTGSRTADGIVFRWKSPVPLEPGDEWLWQLEGTEEFARTTDRRLVLPAQRKACLIVLLERGTDQSPSARQCVT